MQSAEQDLDRRIVVVGIGASAGGLDAFTELLRHLPSDTGMAFALVQHLDPRHESLLPDLLAAKTSMRVVKVLNDTQIEPNHIYVIPPNTVMRISGNLLKLEPRPAGPDQYRPIDFFFSSLAHELQSQAVAVVLSGAATDGTLGLKSVKSEGGITFAQDDSAKFDSMPHSAIAAGAVDFVLSPARIAEEIAAIGKHAARIRELNGEIAGDGATLHRLLILLRNNTGVDFTQYKQPTVLRRVTRRMVLTKTETLEQYLETVKKDHQEAKSLFDDMLINVTEFFRDPEMFEAAKRTVFASALRDHKPSETIRAWVPGCSSGEEVYSIAIALLEYFESEGVNFNIQIFGTDVSDATIERARAASYGDGAVANVSPERLRRFFVRTDSGYQISRTIRDMCIFSRHNLAKDPPLSRMDLISCRNLLIYFSPTLQKRVVATLGYALRSTGCLILGSSESLGSLSDLFTPFDPENKIFCRKQNATQSLFELSTSHTSSLSPFAGRLPGQTAFEEEHEAPSADLRKFVDDVVLSQFAPPALMVDEKLHIVQYRGNLDSVLSQPTKTTNVELMPTLKQQYRGAVSLAIEKARRADARTSAQVGEVQITVVPLSVKGQTQHFLVLFGLSSAVGENSATNRTLERKKRQAADITSEEPTSEQPRDPQRQIEDLEQELQSTREYLQSVIEELRSTNEEAQSANEELRSTNEEVQTAKEELQSTNEELNTINAEMESRNMELTQLNDDLTNLLSSINTPIVMTGGDLRIRRFTPAAEKVLRLIPADVGRPISDLKPRINVDNLEDIFQGVLENLQPHEQEVKDSEGRSYLMRLRPYRTADNRIDGAVLQLLDVTELKQSLERVNRARNYAESIVNTVRQPLVVLDQKCLLVNANRAFYELLETTVEAAARRTIFELGRNAFDLPNVHAMLDQLSRSDAPIRDVELEYGNSAAGDVRTLLLNGRRLKGFDEEPLLLLAFEDITERKRAAEARYRRLFESARDGIIVLESETGELLETNPFAEHLLGFSRDEMIGRKLWEIESFQTVPEIESQLARIRDKGTLRFDNFLLRTKEGREIQTEVVASIFSENQSRAIQFNIRDVTERKKFERELQESQRLESLGLLAGGVAHDFNNLLTGIMGNASLVMSKISSDESSRTNLRDIIRASERAAFLTRQMLAYAGKGRFLIERIRLPELVEEISSLISANIPNSVELRIEAPPGTLAIEGDPAQIQQLVMNLVLNGAEAIGEGAPGRVDVRTGVRQLSEQESKDAYATEELTPGTYVSLEVTDTGCGMDAATLARIFDPFFTTKFTGRGLGLAAAQGIVRGHRGAMRVYSTPGIGTQFDVLLPAAKFAVETPKRADPDSTEIPSGAVILVIDDEEIVRTVAASILIRSGFKVLTASDGIAGVEMFREHTYLISAVVLDLTMPLMGGKEALARMKEISADVPVILSSGYEESETLRQLGPIAPDGFLRKPFSDKMLVQTVAVAMAKMRTSEA